MGKVATASDLGFGSEGLCPSCENTDCWRYRLSDVCKVASVVECCGLYKNKAKGYK